MGESWFLFPCFPVVSRGGGGYGIICDMKTTMDSVATAFRPVIHREDGAYWAEIPAMPGCVTVADTPAELKRNIVEAATAWVESRLAMEMRRRGAMNARRSQRRQAAFA